MITLDPVWTEGVQQRLFRVALRATAYAGRPAEVSSIAGGAPAWLAYLATMCDAEVTVCDLTGRLDDAARAMLESPEAGAADASFVLAEGGACLPGFEARTGDVYRPELGATVVLIVERVLDGGDLVLSGPGVDGERSLGVEGIDPAWLAMRDRSNADLPAGVDFIVCDAERLVCLPRTTVVTRKGAG